MNIPGLKGMSLKDLGKGVMENIKRDDCAAYAAAIAYYLFYALFPFLLFLTALLPYLPIPDLFNHIMEGLAKVVPQTALDLVKENIAAVVSQRKAGLLSLGAILALWTSSSAVISVMDALNHAYTVTETRSFIRQRLTAIILVVGFSIFVVAATVLLMFGPQIGHIIAGKKGFGDLFVTAWNILRWPVLLFLMIVAVSVLYYFAPNVKQKWHWITPGSTITIVVWVAASLLFSWYVENFGSYNKTYGSIGTVIILLTWMFISGFVLLIGGEINSQVEFLDRQRENPPGRRESLN